MRKNVCGLDRAARLLVGAALVLVAVRSRGGRTDRGGSVTGTQILAGYAGADLVITGLMQWCPTTYALGIDTCGEGSSAGRRSARRVGRIGAWSR